MNLNSTFIFNFHCVEPFARLHHDPRDSEHKQTRERHRDARDGPNGTRKHARVARASDSAGSETTRAPPRYTRRTERIRQARTRTDNSGPNGSGKHARARLTPNTNRLRPGQPPHCPTDRTDRPWAPNQTSALQRRDTQASMVVRVVERSMPSSGTLSPVWPAAHRLHTPPSGGRAAPLRAGRGWRGSARA